MAFRWKLFIVLVSLLVPALLVFYVWTERWVRNNYLEVVRDQLEREVEMLTRVLDLDNGNLDAQVDRTVESVGRRLTVIADDGTVLADSSFSGPALATMDNHATRPEIVEARRRGRGSSLRFSNSVKQHLLYVARALPRRHAFIRIATSVEELEGAAAELRRALAGHTLILILAALPVALILSRQFSRPLALLDQEARKIAQGDFSRPFHVRGADEVSRLAGTLNSMARQIESQLADLESERNHLRAVLRSMDEGVMVTDQEDRISAVNPALNRIFGLDSDPIGKNPLEVFRSVEVQSEIQGALSKGEASRCEVETNGQQLAAAFAPIRSGDEVKGVVTVLHDLTELRRLERARKDFVGNVSHELRTPLTSIFGYSETLLQGSGLDDMQRKFLEKIQRNATQLKDIVDDLLELSRLESRNLDSTYTEVSLKSLERELRQALEVPLASSPVKLSFRSEAGGETFQAPEVHLRRILYNLLDNALKYTEKGEVEVLVERERDFLRFSVRDTGMGIAEQDIDRVFERFYRGVQARSEEVRGTGLGLSIVKHLVDLLGGRIWVESRMREGTTVFFTLP